MTAVCHNPGKERHEIADGGRRMDVGFAINWGDDDLRANHSKPLVFCSFDCLAQWAASRAGQHDGVTLKEGA